MTRSNKREVELIAPFFALFLLEKSPEKKRTKTDSGKLVKYFGDGLTIFKELGKFDL